MKQPLLVLFPRWLGLPEPVRLSTLLDDLLADTDHEICSSPEEFLPRHDQKLLLCLHSTACGPDPAIYGLLHRIRSLGQCLTGCTAAILSDGETELYTKSIAAEAALALNMAGCALVPGALAEGTGSLHNCAARAELFHTDLMGAYRKSAAELIARLQAAGPIRRERAELLVLHSSNRTVSNTLGLWEKVRAFLPPEIAVRSVGLQNGEITDCRGCSFTACAHLGEQGRCYYGGAITEDVYPALMAANGVLWVCPNYNDSLPANLVACINRLTAMFRSNDLTGKELFGLIVSGYSGGDIIARQLISSLNMNKNLRLPPRFCMLETANSRGEIHRVPGIEERAKDFAEHMAEVLLGPPRPKMPNSHS